MYSHCNIALEMNLPYFWLLMINDQSNSTIITKRVHVRTCNDFLVQKNKKCNRSVLNIEPILIYNIEFYPEIENLNCYGAQEIGPYQIICNLTEFHFLFDCMQNLITYIGKVSA